MARDSILVDRSVLLAVQLFGSSKALFAVHVALVHAVFQVGDGCFAVPASQQLMVPGTMQREQVAVEGDQFTASLTALPADQIVIAGCLINNLHPSPVIQLFLVEWIDKGKSVRASCLRVNFGELLSLRRNADRVLRPLQTD